MAKKNVDLTSQEWRDLVFEGKNHDFGAYQLRKKSDRRHNLAALYTLIGLIVLIRQLIQNRNKQVLEKINALKKKYEEGGFGSLETKDGREKAQEAYNKAASEVRKDSTLSKPVIIIKSTPNASYESLINILDEMQINSIAKYQIDNMTQIDSLMVLDHRGMLKK